MNVVVTYKVPAQSISAAHAEVALGAVPLPTDILSQLGVYVVSDILSSALGIATRTITIRTDSPDPATAAATTPPGYSAGPLETIAVTHSGSGYIRPPLFVVTDESQTLAEWSGGARKGDFSPPGAGAKLQAYLKVVGLTTISAGSGYSAQTVAGLVGGLPKGTATDVQDQPGIFLGSGGVGRRIVDPATNVSNELACVREVAILAEGAGYSVDTVVLFQGARPSVRAAYAYPVMDARGHVLSVQMVDPGDGYVTTPQVVLYDPHGTGKGAEATANMMRGRPGHLTTSVSREGGALTVTLAYGGDGYCEIPSVVIYDPNGSGSGASYTAAPVVDTGAGGHASQMGVSRIDILARGKAFRTPLLQAFTLFDAAYLVSGIRGNASDPLRAFDNLMKTTIQNILATQVTETVT